VTNIATIGSPVAIARNAGCSGEEGVEQPIRVSGGDSDTAVLQRHHNLACFVLVRSDGKFARPIRD
jgi:hypothetical protein